MELELEAAEMLLWLLFTDLAAADDRLKLFFWLRLAALCKRHFEPASPMMSLLLLLLGPQVRALLLLLFEATREHRQPG